MNFQDAVIFLAGIIIIVSAGVVLGAALRGRGVRRAEQTAQLNARKAELYAEMIGALDNIAEANDQRKQWFIHRYYQALVYAPDSVVSALNRYLDAVTAIGAELSSEHLMELRGQAVRTMRVDVQSMYDAKMRLALPELYKIEVRSQSASGEQSTTANKNRADDERAARK
jgi:hypothetical protein